MSNKFDVIVGDTSLGEKGQLVKGETIGSHPWISPFHPTAPHSNDE